MRASWSNLKKEKEQKVAKKNKENKNILRALSNITDKESKNGFHILRFQFLSQVAERIPSKFLNLYNKKQSLKQYQRHCTNLAKNFNKKQVE